MSVHVPHPRVIPQTVDVHVRFLFDGSNMENVFQFFYGSTPTLANLVALATEVAGAIGPKLLPIFTSAVTLLEVFVKDIGYINGTEYTYTFPNGTIGTAPGNPNVGGVSKSITLKTARSGRQFTGRKGIGPISENFTTKSEITSAFVTLLINLAVEMLLSRVGGRFIPVVASLEHLTTAAITGFTLANVEAGSQNSRKGGRGN
jgi:hypothetical protein